jgi:hypothetical protein
MASLSFAQTIPSIVINASNCGFLTVEDNSAYANFPGTEDDRGNYGILLLVDVSLDNVTYANEATYTQLGNPSFPTKWNIDIPNITCYYKVLAYWCNIVHNTSDLFMVSKVVYYKEGDAFYYFDVTSGTYTILDQSNDWTSYCTNSTTLYQYNDTMYCEKTSNYVVTKALCHMYYICDRSNNDAIKTWNIYSPSGSSMNGTPLLTGTYDPTIENPYLLDLTTLGDGVYILEVDDGSNLWNYPIYDFCTTEVCFASMIKDILCTDTQCVETCDENYIIKDKQKRDALNQMIGLYFMLLAKINAERLEYLGIFTIEPDRTAVLQEVDDMLTKFTEISVRCGICNEVDTTTVTTSSIVPPCQSC